MHPRARSTAHLRPVDTYRALFEGSPDAHLIIDGETFVDCNQAAVEMLRYPSREAVLMMHPSELSPPRQADGRDSFAKAGEMIAHAFAKGSHRFEWLHKRADGEFFPVEVTLIALRDRGRDVLHVIWRDLSERKALEARLRHSERMEAVGKLAGGVAHDFNNLLVAILGNAGLLELNLAGDEAALELVHEISKAGDRAATLVQQLLNFARKQDPLHEVVEVGEVIEQILALVRRLVGERVDVVFEGCAEDLNVRVDPRQLEQVLLNLAANARDAMPDGGRLTLTTRRDRREDSADPVSLPAGDYAFIAVSDTGCGMDDKTAAHAFDPFFTTKPVGKGTGLGLASVYGVLKRSGGSASIHSVVGRGSTVELYLPISVQETTAPLPSRPLPAEGGHETILVVEDEPSVARLVVAVLREKGYQVSCAHDGEAALELYASAPGPVDLVVSDVIMPGMTGPEWVSRVEALGQRPRVLYISGYTDDALASLPPHHGPVDLLEKPFDLAQLVGRVRLALDRPEPY